MIGGCPAQVVALLSAVQVPYRSRPPVLGATTPSQWHRERREAILRDFPDVKGLIGREPWTLPALAVVNTAQITACVSCAHLPSYELGPLALFVGGTLSLWQFALLHDVKHGTAVLPKGVSADAVIFYGSLPSLFGYFLYLRYGHLSHHRNFGQQPLRALFDSDKSTFEDGDALFVAHRQSMSGDAANSRVGFAGKEDVGGLGLSISRTIYSLLWIDGPASATTVAGTTATSATTTAAAGTAANEASSMAQATSARALYNACVYTFSMTFERAALVFGGGVVPALTGRNFFFPHKPDAFHRTAATYARVSLAVQVAMLLLAGPGALWWLFWAEVGWQWPLHPASAMFVSNHPSLDASSRDGSAAAEGRTAAGSRSCQPTASVYLEPWYDWLCCFSNYHTEHHDFPDVPAFRLRELRDMAAPFYSDEVLEGCRDGWLPTMRRTFAGRGFYACSGESVGAVGRKEGI